MTPIEGEIAVLGLVISNIMWPSILGALFLSRIWKVSTATKPSRSQQPETEAAATPKPSLRQAS